MGRLRPAIHPQRILLVVGRGPVIAEPIPVAEALAASYSPAAVGDTWGAPWSTTWVRLSGSVGPGGAGRPVEALIDLGIDPARTGFQCEGLVYRRDGSPGKGGHPQSSWVRISRSAAAPREGAGTRRVPGRLPARPAIDESRSSCSSRLRPTRSSSRTRSTSGP